jgi:hypothetical protein
MSNYQQSIGRDRAIALWQSEWWVGRGAREIARFQLFTRELCMPFQLFHQALAEALGRLVFIHELGFNTDGIIHEFIGEADPPTLDEILALFPSGRPSMTIEAAEQ